MRRLHNSPSSHFLLEASLNLIDTTHFALHFAAQQTYVHGQENVHDSQRSMLCACQEPQR